jgi:transposase
VPVGTQVLFTDWTILRMYPPLRHCWAWRGTQAVVPITGENAKRVLFGAIHLRSGHRVVLRRKQAGQADFQAFLRELRRRYRGRPLALLLDRAGGHTAPGSQTLAAQLHIGLLWLPRQRPELNAMDQLWKAVKNAISANRQYASIDQHAQQAQDWIMSLTRAQARRKAGLRSDNFWLRHL